MPLHDAAARWFAQLDPKATGLRSTDEEFERWVAVVQALA